MEPFVLHKRELVIAKELWNFSSVCSFNAILVDSLFGPNTRDKLQTCRPKSIIIGCEDGIVRIYDIPKGDNKNVQFVPKASLETKGGAIQCGAVHDVTRFYQNDLIVGHSTGMLTIFSNHHILCRRQLSDHSIDHLHIQQDPLGNITIVTTDDTGLVSAMTPSTDLWRINLNDVKHSKKTSGCVSVTSLLCVTLTSAEGDVSTCFLAADSSSQLHVFRQSTLVLTLQLPSVVSAMCTGHFVDVDKLTFNQSESQPCKDMTQVALGTEAGNVYLMADFAISSEEYCSTGLPITALNSLHLPSYNLDLLVCTGNFNSVQIFLDSHRVCEYRCSDWVNSMTVADVDGDGQPEIVFGCLDNTIHALKVTGS